MLRVAVCVYAAFFIAHALYVSPARAQVFEVIHPEVEFGGWEVEALSSFVLDDVEDGDERSVHEFAVGFGFTDSWKSTIAVEVENPESENAIVEAFEWENVFLLFSADGHHEADSDGGFSFGVYTAVEVPQEVGIEEGALSVGPIFEVELGPVSFVGNAFVEAPFENDVDPGFAYAAQVSTPLSDSVAVGFEAFGDIEEAFGDAVPFEEQSHFIGPAIYFEADLGHHVLEPRVAVLFGLTEETPDAVLSFNLEIQFGSSDSDN